MRIVEVCRKHFPELAASFDKKGVKLMVGDGIKYAREKGPVERYVEAKGVSFLTKDSRISLDFRSKKFGEYKSGYTVLRTKFDAWLAKKAKDSGVMLVSGVTVDKIAMIMYCWLFPNGNQEVMCVSPYGNSD